MIVCQFLLRLIDVFPLFGRGVGSAIGRAQSGGRLGLPSFLHFLWDSSIIVGGLVPRLPCSPVLPFFIPEVHTGAAQGPRRGLVLRMHWAGSPLLGNGRAASRHCTFEGLAILSI